MDNIGEDNKMDNAEVTVETGVDNRNCKPWKERSTVEKYVSVLIVILLLLFFVMLAILLRPKGAEVLYSRLIGTKTCTSVSCVREGYRLLNRVDLTVDACDDFSELVCKSHQDETSPYKSSYVSDANDELLSTVQELIENADDNIGLGSLEKARKFYHSCLSEDTENRSTGNIVRELLRKAKMTDGPMPSENTYSREKTLALLTIYGNKNPFFKFRRTPQVIYLYPGSPVLMPEILMGKASAHMIKRMKYEKLIFNALLKMDIPEESASIDAEKMVKFEITFAKLAETAKCTGNSSEVALREMEHMFPELKWSVIVRYIYEYYGLESDFSEKLTIVLTCEDYFRKVIHLMSSYDFRTLELFIMWSFTLHYLPALDPTFRPFYREIEEVVETHWHGNAHDAEWKICTYATMYYFNCPIAHLYYKNKHSEQTEEKIRSIFENIQVAYEEVICAKEWLDETTATQCKTTVRETELIMGLPSRVRDLKLVDAMYSLVNVTDDVMENLLMLDKATFAENVIGTRLTPFYSSPMNADVYYDHGIITILIGATLPPVFLTGVPRYLNYGWMGFILAREMWKSIELLALPDGSISPNEARELHIMKGCLVKQYTDCERVNGDKTVATKKGIEYVMADQTALLIAAKAYEDYVGKNGDEESLPGLNLSNKRQFFINFGQLMCGSSVENFMNREERFDLTDFNACRLNNIIGNSPQFSEAFNCSEKRNKSGITNCQVWI